MPDATAFLIESPSASASGIETTRPSGLEATAASISCAICDHVEGVRARVFDGHAEVLGRHVDAVLDHRPERVGGLAMGDDDEAHVLGDRRAGEPQRSREDGSGGKFAGHGCCSLSWFSF